MSSRQPAAALKDWLLRGTQAAPACELVPSAEADWRLLIALFYGLWLR